MDVKQQFATRLKALREEKGLNQTQLARELDISRGSISFYENRSRTPDIEIFDRICKYFNVSYDYMLGKSTFKKQNITISAIKEYTGLSEKAIETLKNLDSPIHFLSGLYPEEETCNHKYSEIANKFFEHPDFLYLLGLMNQCICRYILTNTDVNFISEYESSRYTLNRAFESQISDIIAKFSKGFERLQNGNSSEKE